MKERIYGRFIENDTVCMSFTKNVFAETSQNLNSGFQALVSDRGIIES